MAVKDWALSCSNTTQHNTSPQMSSAFTANHQLQLVAQHCLSSWHFVDNAQGLVPANPQTGQHNFPTFVIQI
jgi:hypothetical protein